MCWRFGIVWRCNHKWTAWAACTKVTNGGGHERGEFYEACPGTDMDREHTPTKISFPNSSHWVNMGVCCSPQCCSNALHGRQIALQQLITNGASVKTVTRTKEIFTRYVQIHLITDCMRLFKTLRWRTRAMASTEIDEPRDNWKLEIDRDCIEGANLDIPRLQEDLRKAFVMLQSTNNRPRVQYTRVKEGWYILHGRDKEYDPKQDRSLGGKIDDMEDWERRAAVQQAIVPATATAPAPPLQTVTTFPPARRTVIDPPSSSAAMPAGPVRRVATAPVTSNRPESSGVSSERSSDNGSQLPPSPPSFYPGFTKSRADVQAPDAQSGKMLDLLWEAYGLKDLVLSEEDRAIRNISYKAEKTRHGDRLRHLDRIEEDAKVINATVQKDGFRGTNKEVFQEAFDDITEDAKERRSQAKKFGDQLENAKQRKETYG